MASEIDRKYSEYYQKRDPATVYPSEFVVRAFLGTYPKWKADRNELIGRSILDLGCGDGRNMGLLSNIGMEVHGVEISQDICDKTVERMARAGIAVQAKVGTNSRIPFADSFFDHVLACHSCYYVEKGQTIADNLAEIARVMKSGGLFVHSLPIDTSYIMDGARDLGDGHMEIAKDPVGVRVGSILKKFDSPAEIEAVLGPWFADFRIGSWRNDFWGIDEHVWIVVCRRH